MECLGSANRRRARATFPLVASLACAFALLWEALHERQRPQGSMLLLFLLLSFPSSPDLTRLTDEGQSCLASRRFPLLKIPFGLPHLVGHVSKTDDLVVPGLCQRVEGGRLHFHCQDTLCAALRDQRLRLPKRRIGRPTRSYMQGDQTVVPVCAEHLSQHRVQVAVGCGRHIMVAGPFVAQGLLDEHHV